MWRRTHPVMRQEAFLEGLRSRDPALLDDVVGLALERCDVVFVSGISDVKLGPDDAGAIEAIGQLRAWYPRRDQYLLPVDPKRPRDRVLLRRLIPYTIAAEGWSITDGVLDAYTMDAADSGRMLWWAISPTLDISNLPDGVGVWSRSERDTLGFRWMRRSRQRKLRILRERTDAASGSLVRRSGVVDDLRTQDSGLLDAAVDLALAACDLVFVSGLSDVRFGPDEADVAEAMAELCARYPDRDAYMLPVDPKRPADRELLRRIMPFAMIAEGWTLDGGFLGKRVMGAEDSGRILWWSLDSTFDAGSFPDGIEVMTGQDDSKGEVSMRKSRQRLLRKIPLWSADHGTDRD